MKKHNAWQSYLSRARGWISLVLLVPIGILAVLSKPHLDFDGLPEFLLEVAGWMLFLGGAILRWWATLYIGGRKNLELVTLGPYSVCRNPLYVANGLMALSVALFLQSFSLFAAIVLVGVTYLAVTVPTEERRLLQLHGCVFTDYCQRVPRFVPRFALHQTPASLDVEFSGIQSEFRRMWHWSALPMGCYLIEHLRMLPTWPTPFTLP